MPRRDIFGGVAHTHICLGIIYLLKIFHAYQWVRFKWLDSLPFLYDRRAHPSVIVELFVIILRCASCHLGTYCSHLIKRGFFNAKVRGPTATL